MQVLPIDDSSPQTQLSEAAVAVPARPSVWHRLHIGALLAHLLLAIFFTWPLVLNFLPGSGTLVPGVMLEDRDQNLWNLWWVRESLLRGHNPFVTDMLYWPTPVSLYYHTLNIFNGLLALPLLSVFSLTTTYNLVVLFSFVMAGYGAFLLIHYICGNRWAALIGSVVFAYSAYHIATMRSLLQLISLEWIPFFVLFLLKAVYELSWDSRSDFANWLWRRALPAAFFLFLVSLVDWYYTMYALMLAGFLAIYLLVRNVPTFQRSNVTTSLKRVAEPLTRIAICLAIYALLVSPILLPMYRELRSANYMQPAPDAALENSADLLTFFQPVRGHKLWGGVFTNRREWPYGSNRYEVYATYTALLLAGVGLFATRRRADDGRQTTADVTQHSALSTQHSPLPSPWFWAACVLIFFLLALGPVLQINGNQITGLPMPYWLVERIPVLNISRSPDRFDMPLTLCLGVLAGYGANVLLKRWNVPTFQRSNVPTAFAAGCIALIAVELAPMPYLQRIADIAEGYKWIGKQAGDFSILDLPPQDDYWHGAFRMYFQTAHGKRIYGGYISREFPHPFLKSTPGYQELTYSDGGGDMFAAGPDQWFSAFAQYNLRYIVLQIDRLANYPDADVDVTPSRDAIHTVLGVGATPVYSDAETEVYEVKSPKARLPFLSVGDGWQPRERNDSGQTYRWLGNEATLRIDAPRAENAYLTFQASALQEPRQLQIYHGDHLMFDAMVQPGLQTYRTSGPLGLPQGVSTLRFVSPSGTVSPAALGIGDDPRQLSFVLMGVGLER